MDQDFEDSNDDDQEMKDSESEFNPETGGVAVEADDLYSSDLEEEAGDPEPISTAEIERQYVLLFQSYQGSSVQGTDQEPLQNQSLHGKVELCHRAMESRFLGEFLLPVGWP